ncbi:hypothetical protein NLI96_g8157 [Meripilus lineatus]|uniref:Rhomboid-type serine protease n=1 Tax=Meripilus lineatus TaxID=2056292 RepID=A0AAD5V2K3_9APHY|nr:hypothetical protein NLI96_g8157 [Physisporinus lineatus]
MKNDSQVELIPGENANLLAHDGQHPPSFPVAQYDPTNVDPSHDAYGHRLDPSEDTLNDPQGAKDVEKAKYEDFEYADPYNATRAQPLPKEPTQLQRFLGYRDYSLAQRIENKKRGVGRQRYPVVVWVLTVAMVAVFIYELVLNAKNQGNPFSFKPVVNPMLGPSSSALINAGARYPPCMKEVTDLPLTTPFPCLNDTANPPDRLCPLEDICGFGGFHNDTPDQWWRFITPIFLHAGVVHILLNMLAQLTASADLEKDMGSVGFFIVYFAAGIFGNVLGGNFSLVGTPSVGASGAIFGTIAVGWIDLFAHWRYHFRPGRRLVIMLIELIIGFAIGFIPYVDNFGQ